MCCISHREIKLINQEERNKLWSNSSLVCELRIYIFSSPQISSIVGEEQKIKSWRIGLLWLFVCFQLRLLASRPDFCFSLKKGNHCSSWDVSMLILNRLLFPGILQLSFFSLFFFFIANNSTNFFKTAPLPTYSFLDTAKIFMFG